MLILKNYPPGSVLWQQKGLYDLEGFVQVQGGLTSYRFDLPPTTLVFQLTAG